MGLQQVFAFSHEGRLELALGTAGVGGWDGTHFKQPTDVQVRPDGSFYVSDGYVNSRVALVDARGQELREWGRKGAGEGEFSNPHGLTLLPGSTDVLVADREKARLQLFDEHGASSSNGAAPRTPTPPAASSRSPRTATGTSSSASGTRTTTRSTPAC